MPTACAFGSVFTRPSPTSRGRVCCVSFRMGRGREQTAAGPRAGACRLRGVGRRCLAPVGKGCCRCAGSTLFALRAKALQSGAPDHGVSREGERFGTFCPSGDFPGAPGNGETGRCAFSRKGWRLHAISRTERARFPAKPSTSSYRRKRGALQGTPHCPSRKTSPACAQDQRSAPVYDPSALVYDLSAPVYAPSAPVYDPSRASYGFPTPVCGHSAPFTPSRARKSQLPTLPTTASSPRPSRRENGGLCPHPPKGLIPWESLFGSHLYLSRLSAPKTPQAASPCSWACRRLFPPSPHSERNAAPKPPYSWGLGA